MQAVTESDNFASARALLEALRARRVTSRELTSHAIARHRALQPSLNALAALDEARALHLAEEADRDAAAGRCRGPLHGLPITVKDCFEVVGLPAANGAAELRDYRPASNSPALQRLVDAGALVIGKSNVPLASLDLQTYSEAFGTTRNPWNPERTPGGSSGGAAVAIATGITALELGSDLAGSLRLPAHCTGICALKPSHGIVSTAGVLAPGPGQRLRVPDLSVVGPLARTVDDLALALGVVAGAAGRDAEAWQLALPPAPSRPLRAAAWLDDATCPVDLNVAAVLDGACAALEGAGLTIERAARPRFDAAACFRDFCQLMYGEMSVGFPDALYRTFALAARRGGSVEEWTPLSAMPADITQSHRDWLAACERRERYRRAWDELFGDFDVLLMPVAPTTAMPHDHRPFEERSIRLRDREHAYMQQAFWCALPTIAYLPAAVVPVGIAADGLPVGIQIVARYLGDYTALAYASEVERVCGGFRPPPV